MLLTLFSWVSLPHFAFPIQSQIFYMCNWPLTPCSSVPNFLSPLQLTRPPDISMPIMDGIQSTRHIRHYERENSLTPVALIALTGAANPTTRQEAFASGVDLYLTKPIAMKSLKSMLEDLGREGREGFGVAAA